MARGNPIATNRSVHRPKGKMTPAYIRDTRHIAVKVFTEGRVVFVYDARKNASKILEPTFIIRKVGNNYRVFDNITNKIVFEHASIAITIKRVDALMETYSTTPKEQR